MTHDTSSVYCLRNLPEEVVAVLFAYYSRSRESLRENLQRLLAEGDLDLAETTPALDEAASLQAARDRARAFHEKWVIGYGHSSVAEHAVVHVAIEDVSILTSKRIEDARLASFTEKSTRYVPFDTRRFHTPEPFRAGPAGQAFAAGIDALMSAYDGLMEPLTAHIARTVPPKPNQTERAHEAACRAQACDVLRYLLPAATHTNIGMTVNARALEGLLCKLLSDPLAETRSVAEAVKTEAGKIVPTLLKYAAPSAYRRETEARLTARQAESEASSAQSAPLPESRPRELPSAGVVDPVRLVRHDADAVERVALAILYGASGRDASALARDVTAMSPGSRQALIDDYLADRGRFDAPLRALEATGYLFEVTLDYGAYRDVQRHRMAGQYPQRLTPHLGFERPPLVADAGLAGDYDQAIAAAARAWRSLAATHPDEAQYVLPLACRKRLLLEMNLRELHHFVTLRSARQGHSAYRRVAQAMHRVVAAVHPGLAAGIRVDVADYDLARG